MKDTIVRPLITEKLNAVREGLNQYAFEVEISATKPEIKKAIEQLYPDVKVKSVNTLIVASKPKGRFTKGGYVSGRTSKWKKAIVTLQAGSEIDLFSEV